VVEVVQAFQFRLERKLQALGQPLVTMAQLAIMAEWFFIFQHNNFKQLS
jgi:hypothetical protein